MTIEERVEFLRQSIKSRDRQLAELTHKIAGLTDKIAIRTANIDMLARKGTIAAHDPTRRSLGRKPRPRLRFAGDYLEIAVTNQDATAIRRLARLAEAHERRFDQLDSGRPGQPH